LPAVQLGGANYLSGLWVTDATAGVTLELVPGAGGASHPAGQST
jgi:hypothetical protein